MFEHRDLQMFGDNLNRNEYFNHLKLSLATVKMYVI